MQVLERDPTNEKNLQRRGKARYLSGNLEGARGDLAQCDPKNPEVQKYLKEIDKQDKKAEAKQKKKFAGMFDKGGLSEDTA